MNEPMQEEAYASAPAKSHFWNYLLTVILTIAIIAGSLTIYYNTDKEGFGRLLGYDTGSSGSQNAMSFDSEAATATALAKLKTAFKILDEQYFKDITDAQMLEAMTSGLIDEIGSRYTRYLTAEQNAQLTETMSGAYVGIGATVSMNKDGLVEITEVIEGSPAETAGIHVGDLFIKVGDADVSAVKTVDQVAAKVRGTAGTTVDLVMYRPSESKDIKFTVIRKKIASVSVKSKMLTPTIGYVQIREFSAGVSQQFIAAMDSLQAQGAKNIVFDMRNDSGGLATEVIAMLDYLLPEGTIATIKGRKDGEPFAESWTSNAAMGVPATMRYAILTNGMTASASELFSGCLRDYDKAWLIGEQTFGKGSGTNSYNLADGSAVNITTFLYYLPKGSSIEEVGLTPDQPVTLPETSAGLSIYQMTLEQDTQLGAAISYLETLK